MDYSTLTDSALNRAIAEKLGYTEIEPTTYWLDDYYGSVEVTALQGRINNDTTLLPKWSTDLNAAVLLLEGLPSNYIAASLSREVSENSTQWRSIIIWPDAFQDGKMWQMSERAETPARAICLAWLAYKESIAEPSQ